MRSAGKVVAPPRSHTIRTFATILVSLLIAVALGTVLYALVLSIGRDALPGATERYAAPEFEQPPTPKRLPPIAGIETSSVPAIEHLRDERIRVPIQIDNVPEFLRNTDAGIATFRTLTGGDFHWLPLSEASTGENGALLTNIRAAVGTRLTVTLSASRAHARHGYIARQIVDVEARTNPSAPIIKLNAIVHDVQINLPTNVERAGPLRLQRVDDRRWLPMLHSSSGLALQRGVTTSLRLAPGTYELQDPLASDRSQQFTVPDVTEVEVSSTLAPAADGRL